VAVVRQPGASGGLGGRLDVGTYAATGTRVPRPAIRSNSANRGGGLVVVDKDEWGGHATARPAEQTPEDVPSARLEQGAVALNRASGDGAAAAAYGGVGLELSGPVRIGGAGQGDEPGLAVADAYFWVTGDAVTEAGGGIGLTRPGWPIHLTEGFTGQGSLVVESAAGLSPGQDTRLVVWRSARSGQVITAALGGLRFELAEVDVALTVTDQGEILAVTTLKGTDTPTPPLPTSKPTPTPTQPTPTQPAPTQPAPTQSPPPRAKTETPFTDDGEQPPTSSAKTSQPNPAAPPATTAPAPDQNLPIASASASPRPSASASGSPSRSATPSPSGSGQDEDAGEIEAIPEPPAGASMRTLGFGLMAVGVFGLALLGIVVMRRSGFFAA
jgi:hypothetical protein